MATTNHTYNVIVGKLKNFADYHLMINHFSHGDDGDMDLDKFPAYPFMHIVPESFSINKGEIAYTIRVFVLDLLREKDNMHNNAKELVSDCLQIYTDLIATIANDDFFGDDTLVTLPASCEPVIEDGVNVLCGVVGSVTITTDLTLDFCLVPLD